MKVERFLRRAASAVAVTAALGGFGLASAQAETTLNVVMHSDLKIVDPIWTTAYMSRNYGYMVYDTLFAINNKGEVKPQMVDTWTVSPDGLVYDFKLRDGLKFHDGAPVTGKDVVASLKRWGARDALGQKLMSFVKEMKPGEGGSFQVVLNAPTGLLLQGLGKPSSNVPFIMPERVANTPPNEQLTDYTGSGPFVFVKDEWKPGDQTVFRKFADYKPRPEPQDGLAGGKVVNVDRVVWKVIRDPQTAMNALSKGEIDVIEIPSHDLLPVMKKDPNIKLEDLNPFGNQYTFRFNVLHKPFDNPKIRQALFYAFNQEDFLQAVTGSPDYYKTCKAMFICGTPLATETPFEDKLESNFAKAREMIKEAGYDGTPVLLMHSTDLTVLTNLAPVAKDLMEQVGLKVDMQSMDWQTLVGRRAKKDAPADGGWNAFLTSWNSVDNANPVSNGFLNAACDKALFGWPCDEKLQQLRDAFAKEADPAKSLELAKQIQIRAYEYPTFIHLGQWYAPVAMGKNISGAPKSPVSVFWGYKKN